jgi:hypothetical protein
MGRVAMAGRFVDVIAQHWCPIYSRVNKQEAPEQSAVQTCGNISTVAPLSKGRLLPGVFVTHANS